MGADAARQQLRMLTARDGTRLAAAVTGDGYPLVKAANWLSHLESDWTSDIWRHWWTELARDRALVRYDSRGTGMSQRMVGDLSFETLVADLGAVVDTLDLDQFDLLGMSQGAPVATAYAAAHPERVRRLVVYGGYAVGRGRRDDPAARSEGELLVDLARTGWGTANPAYRRVFATLFFPDATPARYTAFDELQRASAAADVAARMRQTFNDVDVRDAARRVRAGTLVLHARHDGIVPFEEGARLAAEVPGARFVPLESRNHILLADEPAWPILLREVRAFLPLGAGSPSRAAAAANAMAMASLTIREREILLMVADGLSNAEIAERLGLSDRTIERHLSNIYGKLGLEGKAARAAAAARLARER